MEKSRDDVKRFLSIPMELDRKIYETEEIIETLRARAAKTTSQLSPAPGGGSGDKGKVMEELVIRIDELEQEAERMRQEKEKAAAEVTLLLSQMPNSAEVKVLMMHYVELMEFDTIGSRLNYGERYVYKLHLRGLAKAAQIWQKKGSMCREVGGHV